MIVQDTVKGKRRRGRQMKRCDNNIKGWTGITRAAEDRTRCSSLWCPLTLQGYEID